MRARQLYGLVGAEATAQMICNAQGVGHDGERRIYGGARREEASVHDVEIVHFMRLAVHIESGRAWVFAKANCSVLVCDARKRNPIAEEKIPGKEAFVAVVAVNAAFRLLFHKVFQLRREAAMRLFVVWRVLQDDFALTIERDAVV